jgi:uncharacterized protein (DUF58 family)
MTGRLAFPLISRRRLVGGPFGQQRSARRGRGSETAGTRPYLPGDPIATIEWVASARLSAAHGADEFIVRERFAEEAPVVAIVVDRRPSMGIHDPSSPWLDKPRAASIAVRAIVESADEARAAVGLAGGPARAERVLQPARGRVRTIESLVAREGFEAPDDVLDRAIAGLSRRRARLPTGSFVFLVSDFLGSLEPASRARLRGLGADIVPVIVQDPTWEQGVPDVGGVLVPFADPVTGRPAAVRLKRAEAQARDRENRARLEGLLRGFRNAGFDPLVLGASARGSVLEAFDGWAERRRARLRRVA